MQRPVRSVETLPCKLGMDEIVEKSETQCSHLQKIQELDKEAKSQSKYYKSEIEKLETEVSILSECISTRKEYRSVECSIVWDFDDKKKKLYYRNDTGELVREVPISEYEMQEELQIREEEAAEVIEDNTGAKNQDNKDVNGPESWPDTDTPFSEDE